MNNQRGEQGEAEMSVTDAHRNGSGAGDAAATRRPVVIYSPGERALLFLSKTDRHALQVCTPEARMAQTSLGAMVLIAGVLAFCSSFFAVHSVFFGGASSIPAVIGSGAAAMLYATIIMAFDRELVTSREKWVTIIRIPLSILIGMVIAFPIELKLFEGRITSEIMATIDERNAEARQEIANLEQQIAAEREHLMAGAIAAVTVNQGLVDQALDEYDRERKRVACREVCERRLNELNRARAALTDSQGALEDTARRIDAEIDRRFAVQKAGIAQIRQDIATEKQTSHDLASQTEALDAITDASPMMAVVSWLLRIFITLLDLLPALTKLFMPYSEYHAYIDARRRLNVSKTVAVTNHLLEEIKAHPERVHLNTTEATKVFAQMMEDRSIDLDGAAATAAGRAGGGAQP